MNEIWKHRQYPITVEIREVDKPAEHWQVTANTFQFGHRRATATIDDLAMFELLKLMLTIGGYVPVTPEAAKGAAA